MNTYILIYDDFAQFEVILANYFLKTKGKIITVGINKDSVISSEGFITVPHISLDEVLVKNVDLFIIPGGNPENILDNKSFYTLLKRISDENKKIGAICSGVIHLAKSEVLNDKKFTTSVSLDENKYFNKNNFVNQNVIVDNNIITAKANGYVDFALELGKVMGIYESEEDLQETISYFKEFKDQ